MKLWGGRFSGASNALVDQYNASIGFDCKLAAFDILGSVAHVKMLAHCRLIDPEEARTIIAGLLAIQTDLDNASCEFRIADEDIHMNIERMLTENIGPVAGKLHSGRSRNDQVALDIHLYARHYLIVIVGQLQNFLDQILQIAENHLDTILPGYTHMQRAEPVRLAHHLLAYFQMFLRDAKRFIDTYPRINSCPLGAGALAGSGLAVDRKFVADLLGFDSIYANSMDAVSDRDFIVEFLAHASLLMMHLSRLSEELILWSSQEFAFIELDDTFSTGSSMMPQKKNPDVCELARGKTGRVYGALVGLLTVLKGLPMTYNKDMQEDKEGLFDTVETLTRTLAVYPPMLASMKVETEHMREAVENDFSNATNLANYLTQKHVPFRQAHEITGKIVSWCIQKHCLLKDIPLETWKSWHSAFEDDIYQAISSLQVIEDHRAAGGTARAQVEVQIHEARQELENIASWLASKHDILTMVNA